MSEKQAPLQIRSLTDALAWLERTFRSEDNILRPNHVGLQEGIVLRGDLYIGPGLPPYTGWQWTIQNVRNELLARGFGTKHADWNAEALLLWRACLAWGPSTSPETEYVYFTTFVDDNGERARDLGRIPMPHDEAASEGVPVAKDWELVSTSVAPPVNVYADPRRNQTRIYYHWRRVVR